MAATSMRRAAAMQPSQSALCRRAGCAVADTALDRDITFSVEIHLYLATSTMPLGRHIAIADFAEKAKPIRRLKESARPVEKSAAARRAGREIAAGDGVDSRAMTLGAAIISRYGTGQRRSPGRTEPDAATK